MPAVKKITNANIRMLVDGYDFTLGGLESVWSALHPTLDVTDFADSEIQQIRDIQSVELSYSGLFHSVSSSGGEAGLKALVGSTTVRLASLHLGTTEGDLALQTQVFVTEYRTAPRLHEAVPIAGGFAGNQAMEFGRILAPFGNITSSSKLFANLDGGAASTKGAVWGYHATAVTGKWNVQLQHSSSATGTFTNIDADSSVTAVGAARAVPTGDIKQFVRLRLQGASSDTIKIGAFFLRKQ